MTATRRKHDAKRTPGRKGTYLLFLTFGEQQNIQVGSLGTLNIESGEYCYVGSAMNGLDSRLKRHFSDEKKIHWHIDRLTLSADSMEAYVPSAPTEECRLAAAAEECGCPPAFSGFGSSDCRCPTHLFRVSGASKLKLLSASAAEPYDITR